MIRLVSNLLLVIAVLYDSVFFTHAVVDGCIERVLFLLLLVSADFRLLFADSDHELILLP